MAESPETHKRIEHDLAEEMAYAEVPYREIAARVMGIGSESKHKRALLKAEKAGIEAGKDYIQTQRDLLAKQSGILDYYDSKNEAELEPSVLATAKDMQDFAQESDDAEANRSLMARLWTIFRINAKYLKEEFPGQFVFEDDFGYPQLTEFKLTKDLIEASHVLRNMGPKAHALLEEYYKSRAAAELDDEATTE